MKRASFHITILVLILAGVGPVYGEEPPVYEEEVVVTATRITETVSETPGQTEIISEEEVKNSGAQTVSELLIHDGQTISTNGGEFSQATLRLDGANSTQTLVMVNGIPANQGCLGLVDLSYFPTSIIDKVEIVHGPLSALYGSSALGGAVNIIYDLTGEPRQELATSVSSYLSGQLSYIIQNENWGLAFGGRTSDGYLDNSQTDSKYLFGQYDFMKQGDEYLSLIWQYMTKYGEDPGSTYWPLTDTTCFDENYALNLNGKSLVLGGLWEYKIFSQKSNYIYDQEDSYSTYSRHRALNYGLDLAGLYPLGKHELLTGIILKNGFFDSTDSGNHSQQNGGLFLQDTWNINDNSKFVSGIRWDTGSDFSSDLMPRLNWIRQISPSLTLKFGYGKSFRAPTINELYYQDSYMSGNPNLKPEIGERYDIIGEWRQQNLVFSVNYFQSHLKDGIDWDNPGGGWVYEAVNINSLRSEGVMIKLDRSWLNLVTLSLAYNWIDQYAKDELTGEYDIKMNYFGKQQFIIGLFINQGKWSYGLNERFVQDRKKDQQVLPDYEVTDFKLSYQKNKVLNLSFVISNLTDEEYEVQKYYPMPGREFKLSVNYSF